MTKFLISVPVSAPTLATQDRIPTTRLKESRRPTEVPVSASVMSVPLMDELIHLDFGTDEPVTSSDDEASPLGLG